jgi:hypothetical protein
MLYYNIDGTPNPYGTFDSEGNVMSNVKAYSEGETTAPEGPQFCTAEEIFEYLPEIPLKNMKKFLAQSNLYITGVTQNGQTLLMKAQALKRFDLAPILADKEAMEQTASTRPRPGK